MNNEHDKPKRRVGFDSQGKPLEEVEVAKGVFKSSAIDTGRVRKLGGEAPELELADPVRVGGKGVNPYEGSKNVKAKVEPPKRNRLDTMRALSEEIKRRRALGLPPIEPKKR